VETGSGERGDDENVCVEDAASLAPIHSATLLLVTQWVYGVSVEAVEVDGGANLRDVGQRGLILAGPTSSMR
jgi:hypothetical protein